MGPLPFCDNNSVFILRHNSVVKLASKTIYLIVVWNICPLTRKNSLGEEKTQTKLNKKEEPESFMVVKRPIYV